MAYPSPIVLKNAAAANEDFIRISNDTNKVSYSLSTATLSEPALLVINHQMATSLQGTDRHLVKITKTKLDTASVAKTATLNFTLAVPRSGITRAHIDDMIAELKEFLNTARVDSLMRGEL